ncbi:MAG: hypothetical protein LBC81_01380 [Tannerellaceae bacterium]|jgi:hypothetical protein|nr:hypothetical protein [Tannerellaceae bacterium]
MRNAFAAAVIAILLLPLVICSCSRLDDSYSTNPALHLSFSTDTLKFDTVFAAIGSATRSLMIYNPHASALMIESIRFAEADGGPFRINVDGRRGQSFANIRIAARDSLYLLAEITAEPSGSNAPVVIENRLEFVVNGSMRQVVFQADNQDVNILSGRHLLAADTVWTSARPFLISDSLVIDSGVTLRIEPGATIYMRSKAAIIVNGTIYIEGSPEAPVVIRGDRLDHLLPTLHYDRIPGQWDGIRFTSSSFNNRLSHAIIRNGSQGLVCDPSEPSRPKLSISNTQVANMRRVVFEASNCLVEASNSEFANSEGNIISIAGGEARFEHCTIANYYIFAPGRQPAHPALHLANHIYNNATNSEEALPLRASFANCIVDGSNPAGSTPWTGEISTDRIAAAPFNISFSHCALKTFEAVDSAFANVSFITNQSPLYEQIGNSKNGFAFDFRPILSLDSKDAPLPNQPIIGRADTAIARLYPFDRYGIERKEKADIGAYVFVLKSEGDE